MIYSIEYLAEARAELEKLPSKYARQILRKVDTLENFPNCTGIKRLQGSTDVPLYRLRSGVYRVVFKVEINRVVIVVVRVGHRKAVYR